MSPILLVDDLVEAHATTANNLVRHADRWYIAKPDAPYYSLSKFFVQLRDAWAVLTNRAIAVQFIADRPGFDKLPSQGVPQ
jgi:hypothetical protein